MTALLLPLVAVTLPASAGGADTPAPSCAQPALREAMISQGLPSYAALARGKQTLVKLFMSQKKDCTAKITVRGGTLKIVAGGTPAQSVALANVATLVELPAYDVAAAEESNGDPAFVVAGSVLTPSALPDLSYSADFSATLTYDTVHNGITYTEQTIFFDSVNRSKITKKVALGSKPLRILVVPMGDADDGYASVFPSSASTALANAMQSVHRMLPLPDGIGTVESGAGGLRYTIAPSQQLVDLGPHAEKKLTGTTTVSYLNTDGLFCGQENSFAYIQQKLAEARNAWNSTHGIAAHVDRVLGVVAQPNSIGPTTANGPLCVEGYAGINAPEAWFRLVAANAETKPRHLAGYLGTMEIAHTIGAVPEHRASGDFHSPNTEADGTARERAYNLTRREYRRDDKTAMSFSSTGWHDDNTLLEAADWDLAQCVLTTGTDASTTCSGSDALIGSTTGAAGVLHAAGRTDGTPGGTNLHTYVISNQDHERTAATGPYFIRFFANGLPVREQAVPVHFTHSHHAGGNTGASTDIGIFDIAVDAGLADSFTFVKRNGASDTILYSRRLDAKPQITEIRTSPATPTREPYVQTAADESGPDISPDGKYVVWGADDGLHIRRTADAGGPETVIADAYQADWSNSSDRIAASFAGGIILVDLDTGAATGPPAVRATRTLYRPTLVGNTTVDSALHASWSPDDRRLAVVLDRTSIVELDATSPTVVNCSDMIGCRSLVAANGNTMDWTAWSMPLPGAPGGLIAYERSNTDFPETAIYTLDPAEAVIVQTRRFVAEQPAWGGDRLAFVDARGIATVSAETFAGVARVTEVPNDFWPSLTRDGSIIAFTGSSRDTGFDVFLSRAGKGRTEVVATDDNPADLRMDVFLDCAGSLAPAVTGLYPRTSGTDTVFDVSLDAAAACPDGRPVYRVTDGFQSDTKQDTTVFDGRTEPVVAVATPRPGDAFNEYAPIPVDLGGWAPGGSRLPVDYTLTGPGHASSYTSSSAESPDITAHLAPGSYTLTASVSHGSQTATQSIPFTVLADNDHDGLPNDVDTRDLHSCYPTDAVNNAANAVTDYDGDFLIGRSDPVPCRTAFNATVKFEPQTVQLGSSGTQLTFTITSKLDPSKITPVGTRITRMAGHAVSLQAVSVSAVDARTVTVKFDRQAYSGLALSLGLTSGYVPVTVTLTTPAGTALGADPTYPIHKS